MARTVFANMRGIAHKGSGGMSTVFPDVCKTASPGGPVPIPYPNIAKASDTSDGSKTVKVDGESAMLKEANYSTSNGDEAGSIGGVISSSFQGKAPGGTVERLSQNPEHWRKFWEDRRFHFNPRIPYRLGKPYSPAAPIHTLLSPHSSRLIRTLVYDEAVIRHRMGFPFETDFLVDDQQRILSALISQLDNPKEAATRYTGTNRF